jgi:hypothetical protein
MNTRKPGRPKMPKILTFPVRIPQSWQAEIRALADHRYVSLAGIVRHILRQRLDSLRSITEIDE